MPGHPLFQFCCRSARANCTECPAEGVILARKAITPAYAENNPSAKGLHFKNRIVLQLHGLKCHASFGSLEYALIAVSRAQED